MIYGVTDRLMGRHQRRVETVREALIDKIRNGLLRPGDRFVSARALSQRHSISYQTADRVLAQLAECRIENLLRRATAVINSNSRQRPRGKSAQLSQSV